MTVKQVERAILAKLRNALQSTAVAHAVLYQENVSATVGERPLPSKEVYGQGPPYRSDPGQYPFVDPDHSDHGYEHIGFGVAPDGLSARSGMKVEGQHLIALELQQNRKGMEAAYLENIEALRKMFQAGAEEVE